MIKDIVTAVFSCIVRQQTIL
ncbi:Protein of unknown function [Leuconostoc citreum]|nr:Protein of unknown function [Leuconostoc citreum]